MNTSTQQKQHPLHPSPRSEGLLNRGTPIRTAIAGALVTAAVGLIPVSAHALDGCLVLLCLAAPSWQAIPQCVPPIHQLFHDLEHGDPFPICPMAGAGNGAMEHWAAAPGNCPVQYTHVIEREGGPEYWCEYSGVVDVNINSALWTRTWWNMSGDTVTEYTPAAKKGLGTWDTRFDDDYAKWLAAKAKSSTSASPFCDWC